MNIDKLISRIDLFSDSQEVVDGLLDEADVFESETGEYAYYAKESAVHIEGLWELVKDLERKLKNK